MKSPKAAPFLRVGVTGGIGSGKSLVCNAFREMSRKVIEADTIARILVDSDQAIQSHIRTTFGSSLFSPSGTLDRRALAGVVFSDPAKLKKLNAIVHPSVFRIIDEEIHSSLPEELRPFIVIEAALIYEAGMDKDLDYVLVVDAPEEIRIRRVMNRDGLSRQDVLLRVRAQLSVETKVKKADFVVENNGTPGELFERIRFINHLLTLITLTERR